MGWRLSLLDIPGRVGDFYGVSSRNMVIICFSHVFLNIHLQLYVKGKHVDSSVK